MGRHQHNFHQGLSGDHRQHSSHPERVADDLLRKFHLERGCSYYPQHSSHPGIVFVPH